MPHARLHVMIGIAAAAALTAASCTSQTPPPVNDASCDAQTLDGGIATEAGVCGPLVTGCFTADTMLPPEGAHQGKCSASQVADYAACQTDMPSLCDEFLAGHPNAGCAACIETKTTSQTWGVLLFSGGAQQARFNYGGCVDLALGEVALEPASCGQLLYASYRCQEAACAVCEGQTMSAGGDAFTACIALALVGQCEPYDALVESPTGPCAAMFDGSVTDVSNCFPDPAITDAVPQRKDFLTRIVTYFCGYPADAGP